MAETRARELADLANNATGLETLTVSDITDLTASATELNYSDGVGSALQTQINAKAPIASPTFTGTTNVSSGVTLPAGHVLQVESTLMGDRLNFTPTSQTWTDIAGLSVQITPSSSSNKIMVFATVQGNSGQSVACFLRTMRDSTAVGIANTSGSRSTVSGALKEITSYDIQGTSWNFIDSPSSTSALTYKVQVYSNGGVVINTGTTGADNWSVGVTVSSITVMEIKQ